MAMRREAGHPASAFNAACRRPGSCRVGHARAAARQLLGCTLAACATTWVVLRLGGGEAFAPSPAAQNPLLPGGSTVDGPCSLRASRGFGEKKGRKRPKVNKAQVLADHGEHGEEILSILAGNPAKRPEDMVRARYSSFRNKDPVFMARTETCDDVPSVKQRADDWAVTLLLEPPIEKFHGTGTTGTLFGKELEKLVRMEIVEVEGLEVEWKFFTDEKCLHERSVFLEDEKWGYIYSGESKFSNFDWLSDLE